MSASRHQPCLGSLLGKTCLWLLLSWQSPSANLGCITCIAHDVCLLPILVACLQAKLAEVAHKLPWINPTGSPGGVPGTGSSEDHAGSTGSSSSPVHLTSVPVVGQWLHSEVGAAQPWDLDPAEITICKRPDGSDWVLGVGSFGQVHQQSLHLPGALCMCCVETFAVSMPLLS